MRHSDNGKEKITMSETYYMRSTTAVRMETPMSAYARLCERRYGQSRKSGKFRGYAKRGHSKKK